MKFVEILDRQTGRKLVRKSADAREILGHDPTRYAPVGADIPLKPIFHPIQMDQDGNPPEPLREDELDRPYRNPVTAPTPPATVAPKPPPPAPAKKQPSQATQEKRNAALAKARAARKANLAKAAEPPQAA